MSREDFVAIAVRLFSIYLLLSTIRYVPGAVQLFSQDQGIVWASLYGFILILGFFVCVLLWFFPLSVARKLLPVMHEPRSEQSLDASTAMSVGITLIGIWVMAFGLVDAIYWIVLFVRAQQVDTTAYFEWLPDQIAGMVATAAEVLLAAWLIFGSRGVKRLIYRYRYGASLGAP
ncbi:MAG: hypothetical protein ACREPV_09220 [Lysobacter sp.]